MANRRSRPVRVERVYDRAGGSGHRVLVDRLWPRGVKKDDAGVDEWAKDLAPSTELRRWYGHDPERFEEFARRYRAELSNQPAAAAVERLTGAGAPVVLVTATKDVAHSAAAVLAGVLSGEDGGDGRVGG